MTRAGSLGSQCVFQLLLWSLLCLCAQRSWACCCGLEQGQSWCPVPLQPQLRLFCCRGACAKPCAAQSGVAELVAPDESLCTQRGCSRSPELGCGVGCAALSPLQRAGRALAQPCSTPLPLLPLCLVFAKALLPSHASGVYGIVGWTLQGGEVRSKGWTGHRKLTHDVVELVSHRGQNQWDCSASIPTLHPGSQVIFTLFS